MFSRALGSAARVVKFNSVGTVQAQNINVNFTKNYLARSTHQSRWHFELQGDDAISGPGMQ